VATSTIPALKRQLVAALKARSGLAGIQVSYGAPFPVPEPEWIWVADVSGQQVAAALGQQRREETYTLTVLIHAMSSDPADQQTPTERAFALMAEVEAQLRSDATVGGAVRVAQIEGPIKLEELAGPNARGARVTFSVACAARI
jgi:hypothetical protein